MPKTKKSREISQGRSKMAMFFFDLLNNEKFLKDLEEYKEASRISEEKYDESQSRLLKICAEYGIDYKELNDISYNIDRQREGNTSEISLNEALFTDECTISENKPPEYSGEFYDEFYRMWNEIISVEEKAKMAAYPISIQIRSTATKNDVLDFIDKNWRNIKEKLEWRNETRTTATRSRKNIQIDRIILKNYTLPIKELTDLINASLPTDRVVGYDDVYKIKSILMAKRKKDMRVMKL